MSLNKHTFYQRSLSALVYAVVMLAGLLLNVWSAIVLASLILILCMREYFRLIAKIETDVTFNPAFVVIVQIISVIWLWLSILIYSYQSPWPALLCAPSFLMIVSVLPGKNTWKAGIYALAGMLYIVLPMMLLLQIRNISTVIPIAVLLMIWTSDTMAYLVGSFIGKTPLTDISPNKTWEGTIGGGILTIALGGFIGYFSHFYNVYDWMILSLIVSLTAPLGDLVSSRLKRIAGVKDTGTLMPGHGGALDRFDSLLIALPFTFCYVWFFMPSVHLI